QLQRPGLGQVEQGLHQDQPRGERQAPPVGAEKAPKRHRAAGREVGGGRGGGVGGGGEGVGGVGGRGDRHGRPSPPRRALARNPAATKAASKSAPAATPATATVEGAAVEAEGVVNAEGGAAAA